MQSKVVLTYESVYESVTTQMRAYWSVPPCGTVLNKVFRTFENVNKILKCYHSNEIYWVVDNLFIFSYFDFGIDWELFWIKRHKVKAASWVCNIHLFSLCFSVCCSFHHTIQLQGNFFHCLLLLVFRRFTSLKQQTNHWRKCSIS